MLHRFLVFMSCPTLNGTFDGESVVFPQRFPDEYIEDTLWGSQGERKSSETDPSQNLKAELRMLEGEMPNEGHVGVNLHMYLTSYQEALSDDSSESAHCAEKSFRRLQKAERLVNNIKHAAACVIQKKLFWPWRTRVPMLRQPNEDFEFSEWTNYELEAEVIWYRKTADKYSIQLLQMHGYESEDPPVYTDVKTMSRDELIKEIENIQELLNSCDEYLMQTQKDYEEDMYWQDFEWRRSERNRISGILDKAKMIAEANRCYIGGWKQMQKDLERDDSVEDPDEISDAQWKEWTYNDMREFLELEGGPFLIDRERW